MTISTPGPADPYLSIILFSRNDDYAGGIVPRLQSSLDTLFDQLQRHAIPSEIILVEWNPPVDRPALHEALQWPDSGGCCTIRLITVPGEVHARFDHSHVRPTQSGAANNVGIRRARGAFIMTKASDTFYSEAVMEELSKGALVKDRIYRAERCDTDADAVDGVLAAKSSAERLAILERTVIYRNERLAIDPNVAGDLPILHTNASGDFQLLHRDYWAALRGYKETSDVISYAVDAHLSYAAHALGVKETLFPDACCVYKPTHSHMVRTRGFKEEKRLFQRLAESLPSLMERVVMRLFRMATGYHPSERNRVLIRGVPQPAFYDLVMIWKRLVAGEHPPWFNGLDWGHADESFEERTVVVAAWDDPSRFPIAPWPERAQP
ncbi:MAG: hypothetical protein HQL50_04130 [Magnetococcales bacterium]|nr:hypothetical protein [Magnetococcales bacterium]